MNTSIYTIHQNISASSKKSALISWLISLRMIKVIDINPNWIKLKITKFGWRMYSDLFIPKCFKENSIFGLFKYLFECYNQIIEDDINHANHNIKLTAGALLTYLRRLYVPKRTDSFEKYVINIMSAFLNSECTYTIEDDMIFRAIKRWKLPTKVISATLNNQLYAIF